MPVSQKGVRCEVASVQALLVESNARCFADCPSMVYPKDDEKNVHLTALENLEATSSSCDFCLAIALFSHRWYA